MKTAEDLMTKRFLRISTEHNLREALALLLYGEEHKAETAAIAVIDTQGSLVGILTPECVVSGLAGDTALTSIDDLSKAIDDNFPLTIDHVMKKGYPLPQKPPPSPRCF